MKQVLFRSRLAARSHESRLPDCIDRHILAARTRHSACGVSSLFVRHHDTLLAVLEGGAPYVDRMLAALLGDGWFCDPVILAEQPIRERMYSHVALSLIDSNSLASRPAWTRRPLLAVDHRTAQRILKGLRATHGRHAPPARESFLHHVQVGRLTAY